MTSLRRIKKRLSRCEKFLSDGVRATVAGTLACVEARMEARAERDFVQPMRDLTAILARGGMSLPPRELVRLVRLESIVSRAADRPTVTETAVRAVVADDIDPSLMAELLAGPAGPAAPPV